MKTLKQSVTPLPQEENHTCGYCAAHAAYCYYGLNPEALELRTFLGTDHILPYNFPGRTRLENRLGGADNLFSGTWPMDMLAVLYWDGFDTEYVVKPYPAYHIRLRDHLENGDLALVILYDCYHWAVVSGLGPKGIQITDSILWGDSGRRRLTYWLEAETFALEEHGIILISRDENTGIRNMTYPAFAREYARGVDFCAKIVGKTLGRKVKSLLP